MRHLEERPMSIREAIERIDLSEAKDLAAEYFAPSARHPGTCHYTGAHFESFQAEQNLPNTITPSDLLAVQNLAVTVPARAAMGILGDSASEFSALLTQIPEERDIKSIQDEAEFEKLLGEESHAHRLWDLLRHNGPATAKWGIGPTTASKIMARKRPHLIPIEDSVVDRVIGRNGQDSWRLWWEALTVNDDLEDYAKEVREHAGHTELSTLRTLDIVLWKWGTANPLGNEAR